MQNNNSDKKAEKREDNCQKQVANPEKNLLQKNLKSTTKKNGNNATIKKERSPEKQSVAAIEKRQQNKEKRSENSPEKSLENSTNTSKKPCSQTEQSEKNLLSKLDATAEDPKQNKEVRSETSSEGTQKENSAEYRRKDDIAADDDKAPPKQDESWTEQDALIAKLTHEKKILEGINSSLSDNFRLEALKVEHLEKVRLGLENSLDKMGIHLDSEKKLRADAERSRRKLESELRKAMEKIDELQSQKLDLQKYVKRKDTDVASLKCQMDDDQNQVLKLQLQIREHNVRIGDLEEEIETAQRSRSRAEKLKGELQEKLDQVSCRLEEANGALEAQIYLNNQRKLEMARLCDELEEKNMQHESKINEICSLQYHTLSNFRDLATKAAALENEVGHLLSEVKAAQAATPPKFEIKRSVSATSRLGLLDEEDEGIDDGSSQAQLFRGRDRGRLNYSLSALETEIAKANQSMSSVDKFASEVKRMADKYATVIAEGLNEDI